MLTVIQDWIEVEGQIVEQARAEGREVLAPERATCRLAQALIDDGYDPDQFVRLVRADTLLFPPPHSVRRVRLAMAARIDFFADGQSGHAREVYRILRGNQPAR
ncbi:MAG: hypothetical protein QNJ13_01180 [Paracoccaceae bacterium]|nr:hypothetical protein [Paracoccaceae bacterium]